MKRPYITLFLLLSASLAFCLNYERYVSEIGILGEKNGNIISQYFDVNQNKVKIEIYVHINSGKAKVVLYNPSGAKIDSFELSGDSIQNITKEYKSEKGDWRVLIASLDGSGIYIVKFHDRLKYQGMTEEEKKIIENKTKWELGIQ
jgi:hypothetical protein